MFKSKALLTGIFLAMALAYSPALLGPGDNQPVAAAGVLDELPSDALGYYELDGGKTINPIIEKKGVAERIQPGVTPEEFMADQRMLPEAEASLVHRVPPLPFVLGGIQYEPEQIHLFDGKQLGFTVGNDGRLYAFTSFSALNSFIEEQPQMGLDGPGPEYSIFYEHINYQWQSYRLFVLPNSTLFSLTYMDDMISSMTISLYATLGATLFEYEDLQGDYFAVSGGTNWPNLGSYGWNDRASSLVVWP